MITRPLCNDFPVSHSIVESPAFRAIDIRSRLLYFYLVKHSNRFARSDGWFFRSMRDLMSDIGIGQVAVTTGINELVSIRAIEIMQGKRNIGMFRLYSD